LTQRRPLGYLPRTMHGLYAIVDAEALDQCGLDPVAFAAAVLAVFPAALQLRAKNVSARETLALLRELAPMCHRTGVPLVANDRPDMAILAGCDLVHVGQDDMPIERIRRIAPGLGVGISTHTLEQLDVALAARPAYVAFGPVFPTATKKNPDPVVGLAGLKMAHARSRAAGIPLVAIGGVNHERASTLVSSAEAVAVIADLLPTRLQPGASRSAAEVAEVLQDVTVRARALHQLFAPPPIRVGAAQ
jgi:thiamine-phosphate pyrophosphorylase